MQKSVCRTNFILNLEMQIRKNLHEYIKIRILFLENYHKVNFAWLSPSLLHDKNYLSSKFLI